MTGSPSRQRATAWLEAPRLPLYVAALALLLTLPSIWMGFTADDYLHRAIFLSPPALDGLFGHPLSSLFTFLDGDPARTHRLVDLGLFPWSTFDHATLSFWRPLTALTHWLDYALWPDRPSLMHLHSLLWFAAAVLAAATLYRRFMGAAWPAGLAALLFAIDDAHAMPAGWIANRNGPIALLLGLIALGLHDDWTRRGRRLPAVLAPLTFGLALLSAESGIAIAGYLAAHALFLDPARGTRRILHLAPYAAVTLLWRLYYQWAGYGAWGSEAYIDPLLSPLRFLGALAFRGPLYLLSQLALMPSEALAVLPRAAQLILWAVAILFLAGLLALLLPLLRRDATARFWALGMTLSLIPSCATDPMDRLLLFTGFGAMGLLAQLIVALRTPGPIPAPPRSVARPVYVFLLTVHLVLAPLLLPARIAGFAVMGRLLTNIAENEIPSGPELQDKTLVIANGATYPLATYLFIVRALNGQPIPAHVRCLSPMSLRPIPMRVHRTGENTLLVEPRGGFPYALARDRRHPFAQGETVELTGMTVVIEELTEEGWPARVTYRFDRPLEDPSLLWLQIEGTHCIPFTPPTVGETVLLNQ